MRITLSAITSRKKPRLLEDALAEYTSRLAHHATIDQQQFPSEPALLASLQKSGRTPAKLILLDAGGRTDVLRTVRRLDRPRARQRHAASRTSPSAPPMDGRRKRANTQTWCSPSAP